MIKNYISRYRVDHIITKVSSVVVGALENIFARALNRGGV